MPQTLSVRLIKNGHGKRLLLMRWKFKTDLAEKVVFLYELYLSWCSFGLI